MSKTLKDWHAELVNVLNEHESHAEHARQLLNDGELTEEGVEKRLSRARDAAHWVERVSKVRDDITAWIERAESDVNAARARALQPGGTTNEQLLDEIRYGRAWDRLKARMDAVGEIDASTIGIEALEGAEGAERRIIVEELEPYLAARGINNMSDDVNNALAASHEEYARARTYLQKAQGAASWLDTAAKITLDHVVGDRPHRQNASRLDLQVRNLPEDAFETAPGAGEMRGSNGRFDSALNEFQG